MNIVYNKIKSLYNTTKAMCDIENISNEENILCQRILNRLHIIYTEKTGKKDIKNYIETLKVESEITSTISECMFVKMIRKRLSEIIKEHKRNNS